MSEVHLGAHGYNHQKLFYVIWASPLASGMFFPRNLRKLVCRYVVALGMWLHLGTKVGGSTSYAGIINLLMLKGLNILILRQISAKVKSCHQVFVTGGEEKIEVPATKSAYMPTFSTKRPGGSVTPPERFSGHWSNSRLHLLPFVTFLISSCRFVYRHNRNQPRSPADAKLTMTWGLWKPCIFISWNKSVPWLCPLLH